MENTKNSKRKEKISLFSVQLGPDFFVPLKSTSYEKATEECKSYFLPVEKIVENAIRIY